MPNEERHDNAALGNSNLYFDTLTNRYYLRNGFMMMTEGRIRLASRPLWNPALTRPIKHVPNGILLARRRHMQFTDFRNKALANIYARYDELQWRMIHEFPFAIELLCINPNGNDAFVMNCGNNVLAVQELPLGDNDQSDLPEINRIPVNFTRGGFYDQSSDWKQVWSVINSYSKLTRLQVFDFSRNKKHESEFYDYTKKITFVLDTIINFELTKSAGYNADIIDNTYIVGMEDCCLYQQDVIDQPNQWTKMYKRCRMRFVKLVNGERYFFASDGRNIGIYDIRSKNTLFAKNSCYPTVGESVKSFARIYRNDQIVVQLTNGQTDIVDVRLTHSPVYKCLFEKPFLGNFKPQIGLIRTNKDFTIGAFLAEGKLIIRDLYLNREACIVDISSLVDEFKLSHAHVVLKNDGILLAYENQLFTKTLR
ncbi:hypothetical protein ACOME3_009293 [Neoechinorhynchus agilis]